MHLTSVHLMGGCIMGVYLTGVYLMRVSHRRVPHGRASHVYLIYESSLRTGQGWRESLYRHQRCFEASDCGRLGRQAAGHTLERAPRGEKLQKRLPIG